MTTILPHGRPFKPSPHHYYNDHLGTSNELTDHQDEVVWYADYESRGNTAKVEWHEQVIDNLKVSRDELQPIRFQGQHFDEETGLHYNRFRYFDPDMGMFTTRDTIGLMGGSNVFQYAPNPIGWIDPFWLSGVDGSGRPISSPHYSVWQQFEIPVDVQPGSRGGFQDTRPSEQTWHHNVQNSTIIELVPRP